VRGTGSPQKSCTQKRKRRGGEVSFDLRSGYDTLKRKGEGQKGGPGKKAREERTWGLEEKKRGPKQGETTP